MCECVFVERCPEIAFENGLFFVTEYNGGQITRRKCYLPGTFIAAIVGALDAIEAYGAAEGVNVVPFRLREVG